MARKTANYRVPTEGRDQGKLFVITEMSSAQAEAWATRALLALIGSNTDIPENVGELGMAGLAELGLRSLASLKWEVAAPLLEEMLQCVQFIPDPNKTHIARPLIDDDIEEVATRLALRREWWNLHMGFLQAVVPSLSGELQPAKAAASKGRVTRTSRN